MSVVAIQSRSAMSLPAVRRTARADDVRRDGGYTLAEMLVALAVLGMAIGGLAAGARVIDRSIAAGARATERMHAAQAVDQALEAVLKGKGPFSSEEAAGFVGDAAGFSFNCGEAAPCGASVDRASPGPELVISHGSQRTAYPLAGVEAAHFLYLGYDTRGEHWPPPKGVRDTLQAVALVGGKDGADLPIVSISLWKDEDLRCTFDPIDGMCRASRN
jgi:prepilin-type N-terminal cleavage/methylation domain-containing protein